MSERFREVTSEAPCPGCQKPDWCAWTPDGWLKCERSTDTPKGMTLVKRIDGGALFRPLDDGANSRLVTFGKRGRKGRLGRIVGTYVYRDAGSKPLFEVVRFNPKTFRQRRVNDDGSYTWKMDGVQRVLYHLPRVVAADPALTVFIVEGEKDADALTKLGLVATCNAGGAKKWHTVDDSPLHGRRVAVIPDHDEPGRRHAEQVARSLHGKALSVKVVALPGLQEHGDASDWLAAGGTAEELLQLVDETPEYQPTTAAKPTKNNAAQPVVVNLADVTAKPVQWLWPGRIPCGMVTLVPGDPNLGKTMLILDMAARVSCGRAWPDYGANLRGGVVLLSAEDDVVYTIRPRLEAARADMSRVVAIQGVKHIDKQGEETRSYFSLESDLPALRQTILSMPDTRLVLIDPVSAYCGKTDTHQNAAVRGLLAPLSELAAETGVAIVCVTHLNKSGGRKALYRATGSLAFAAAARAAWLVVADADNGKRRLMLSAKMNVGPAAPGLGFTVEATQVEGVGPVGRVIWEPEPVNLTADEALAAEMADDKKDSAPARNEAANWLRDQLESGAVAVADLRKEAKAAGLTWTTIRRAKDSLGVRATKRGFDGGWTWKLSRPEGAQADPVQKNVSAFERLGRLRVFDSARRGNSEAEEVEGAQGAQVSGTGAFGQNTDDGPPLAELHAKIDAGWADDDLSAAAGFAVGQDFDGGDVQVGDDGPSVAGQGDEQAAFHQGDGLRVANGVGLSAGGNDSEGLKRVSSKSVTDIVGDHTKIIAPERTPEQCGDPGGMEGGETEWVG